MRKIFVLFAVLFCCAGILGAQKKQLTIDEAVIGQYRQFYPQNLNQLSWRFGTQNYVYVQDFKDLVEVNTKTDKQEIICSVIDLNKALETIGAEKVKSFPVFEWLNQNEIQFFAANSVYNYNLQSKSFSFNLSYDKSANDVHFSKQAQALAFTIDNNLYLTTKEKTTAITNDLDKGIVNGSNYVHRQEFGIHEGIFWSPKGNFVAFYRKDERMVAQFPITNFTTRIATVEPVRYPMAGEKSEEVTLGVYDIKSGKTIFIQTGEPKEQYLTSVTWDPSEMFIYVGVLNREQNHLKLNKYNVVDGSLVKTLFEEKNQKYVEPEHSLIFLTKSPDKFLYFSERDGYQHLYLYNTDGTLINQVTKGEWVVTDFIGFDKDEKYIFVNTTKDSPIERQAYRVDLKTGKMEKITNGTGMHSVKISSDNQWFLDIYSNTITPNIINLLDNKGVVKKNIITAKNPYTEYEMPDIKLGTIKSADGKTDLYYRLITPKNLDKNKKYPCIVYVYGGPHTQLVTDSWLGGSRLWECYMAQKGYIVYILDNRGSSDRGFEFESVIHRQCGVNEMADQIKGVDFLKSLGYVDETRIGVHGWSYGGFMTISLLTNYPDVFKVGVAGGPVIDWKYYEVMYGERYMDTPLENPEGYEKTSLLNKAGNLKSKLLIAQGVIDETVVWQHCLQFIQKSIEQKVLVDFFVYPRHEHNVRGLDRVHLMRKVTEYFDENL